MPDTLHTFSGVTSELDRRRFISMGFERIEALLAASGNPERSLRVVQVVGTNGKGTTSVALSAALEVMGETTGTYLSPHVMSYAERVRVRGEQVTEDAFAEGMGRVIAVADENGIEVTQFELLTAGALVMFPDAGVRGAVVEAGLGARYDATTAARPEAVVLTNVALDHMNYLGDTVEEIATEKLASVPESGTLVLGTDAPEVVRLARERCGAVSARLVDGTGPVERDGGDDLPGHLLANASLGINAARSLTGVSPGRDQSSRVFAAVSGSLPGRFETASCGGTQVVLDGGHNVAGLRATLAALKETHPGKHTGVVFGAMRDKDIKGMLELMIGNADTLVLTRSAEERAGEPHLMAGMLSDVPDAPERVIVEPDVGRAVEAAAAASEVVLVAGSFAVVSEAKRYLHGAVGGDA